MIGYLCYWLRGWWEGVTKFCIRARCNSGVESNKLHFCAGNNAQRRELTIIQRYSNVKWHRLRQTSLRGGIPQECYMCVCVGKRGERGYDLWFTEHFTEVFMALILLLQQDIANPIMLSLLSSGVLKNPTYVYIWIRRVWVLLSSMIFSSLQKAQLQVVVRCKLTS